MTTRIDRCDHTQTRTLATRCYTGSVSTSDENRAAHGSICAEVECLACGARRDENRNGRHVEIGEWGDTRAERADRVMTARRAKQAILDALPAPIGLLSPDGVRHGVAIDAEGYLIVRPAVPEAVERAIGRLAPVHVAAATALRRAHLAVQRAEAAAS